MKYYLGLDNGGTTTKAALFTSTGKEVSVASTETRMISVRPGFTERDMDEMWAANCAVIHKVLEKSGTNPADIAGIAICGHGKGLYLWGKDGKPSRLGIISTDNRAWELPLRWKKNGTEKKVFDLSCQHILACQPVALLAWLKENEPDTLKNVQWIFECKDYVRFRLTGKPCAEITDYSGANLINLHTRQYDDELLRLFGIEDLKNALPPLCNSTDICGYVTEDAAALTGLKAGTPVAGGMFDIDACAIAVGVLDEQHICMIAGTWSINEYIRKSPVIDGRVLMNSLFCIPEYYLIEESSPTSAGNFEWFIKSLLPEFLEKKLQDRENPYDELNNWVESIPPEEFCPIFLPFLMGSNVHPNAKGTFVGISNYHTRKHLIRSVYEGIAFSHKYHLDKLLATRNFPPESIKLAGGAARSGVWSQMFADIMQLPIEVVEVNETGALGCAVAAAVAVRDFESLNEAVLKMCSLKPVIQPKKEHMQLYDRKYALYKRVLESLDSVWNDLQVSLDKKQ